MARKLADKAPQLKPAPKPPKPLEDQAKKMEPKSK